MREYKDYEDRTLLGYLPDILKEVRELKTLTKAEQPEITALFGKIDDALENLFVPTAGEYGVKRWEKILKITPLGTSSLDERKRVILAILNERLPFSYRKLILMLNNLCGEDGFVIGTDFDKYFLRVKIHPECEVSTREVREMLKRVLPANLISITERVIMIDIQKVIYCGLANASQMIRFGVNVNRVITFLGGINMLCGVKPAFSYQQIIVREVKI